MCTAYCQRMLCDCLQETAEAHKAGLDFDGIYDLRALLKAVRKGRTLYPLHLHGVASTLEVSICLSMCLTLRSTLKNPHLPCLCHTPGACMGRPVRMG